MFPGVIILVVICLIAVGAYFAHQQAKRRREALAAVAAARGWRFVPDRDHGHDDHFRHFQVFRQGSGRYAYNSIYGELELSGGRFPLKTGDFHYQTRSSNGKGGSTTHHHHLSYLLVDVPYGRVPDLTIRPEGMLDKVSGFFGFDDIDFESAEFSRRFHVKSSDKRFAYDVIHPRMMEFLLATQGPTLSISQGHCCVTHSGTWKPEEFQHYIEWVETFFQQWPRHVTAELESRTTQR